MPYTSVFILKKSKIWIEKPKNKKKNVLTKKVDSAVSV